MVLTSSSLEDFLVSFVRSTPNPRVRIITVVEDPRIVPQAGSVSQDQPPPLDNDAFPPLRATAVTDRRAESPPPENQEIRPTYCEVLKNALRCILRRHPMELREVVWECRMHVDGAFTGPRDFIPVDYCLTRGDNPTYPLFLHPLCLVSTSTRKETFGVFIRNSRFLLRSIAANNFLRAFLASVEGGTQQVQELRFGLFDQFPNSTNGIRNPTNSDLELAVDCRGLCRIQLTFRRTGLGKYVRDEIRDIENYWEHTVDQLIAKYRLVRLLDCLSLQEIHWDGVHFGDGPTPVLQRLADHMKSAFAGRNHALECKVTWRQ